MSKNRSERKTWLNKRVRTIKGFGCQYCPNNKFHSNGIRAWCTKCKKEVEK